MKPTHAAAADGEVALQQALIGPRDRGAASLGAERAIRRFGWLTRAVHAGPVAGLIAQVLLIAAIAEAVAVSGVNLDFAGWVVGIACGVITNLALAHALAHHRAERMSPADWVTLARATLAVGVAALVAASFDQHVQVAMLVSLATLALVLDGVDGWVARRSGTEGALGARFDGEVDAFLILVLSVYVARSAGAWVLAIGAARYVFLAAGWRLGWMRATLPPLYWRKVVCATQGVVLTAAAADVLPSAVNTVALVVALVLLAASFGRDVWWLWSNRHGLRRAPVAADTSADRRVDPPTEPEHGRVRRGIAVTATILAGLVVWVALVAPDQPQYLTLDGFLRIPLELLVLIALTLVLPTTPRRILAVIAGLVLALVVVLKVVNYGVFMVFDRPFDPIGDTGQLGNIIETLRASIGSTETRTIEIGVVAGLVAIVVVSTLAMLRLTQVAATNRRGFSRTLAGLGAVWMLCWAFGAQLISHTPIASTLAASLLVDEVHQVQFDIHDEAVFGAEIKHDAVRNTPTDRLLTGLRGKDVLLVFVESYGQVAVQGSAFSPEVDAALASGNRRLQNAGFSARSGFLTSATFGGISWLAHSSLQSGLWANSLLRYHELITSDRFTLAEAFKRAGWRTVDDVPSNSRPWPQGEAFYHWEKIYNRNQVGYRGPTYNYASMPDQYIYSALQRLELGKRNRRPLFAEVDTVSSHEPWKNIPQMTSWSKVGNGSIFNRLPKDVNGGAFSSVHSHVQAAYGQSIVYALNALTSFVQRYGGKNLVLIVLGDHQPWHEVSGPHPNHDVPISIIAHDPKVLRRIEGWGWGTGLRPSPGAPVWPMSAFRDRFLNAFDSQASR